MKKENINTILVILTILILFANIMWIKENKPEIDTPGLGGIDNFLISIYILALIAITIISIILTIIARITIKENDCESYKIYMIIVSALIGILYCVQSFIYKLLMFNISNFILVYTTITAIPLILLICNISTIGTKENNNQNKIEQ